MSLANGRRFLQELAGETLSGGAHRGGPARGWISSILVWTLYDYEPEGSPASAHGIDILRDSFGIDISLHRSHVASSPSEFLRQSHIFPLTSRHARIILEIAPSLRQSRKIVLEKLGDIEDPWHSRKEVYAACAAEIRECVFEKMEAHFG